MTPKARHQRNPDFVDQVLREFEIIVDPVRCCDRAADIRKRIKSAFTRPAAESGNFVQCFHHVVMALFECFRHLGNAALVAIERCDRRNL